MSNKRKLIISKINPEKHQKYLKYLDGFELLIIYDCKWNKLASINSNGVVNTFEVYDCNGNKIIPPTMYDLIEGRRFKKEVATADFMENRILRYGLIKNNDEREYNNNGDLVFYLNNDTGNWYRSLFDDTHRELYYEDNTGKAISYVYNVDGSNKVIKSTVDIVHASVKQLIVHSKRYICENYNGMYSKYDAAKYIANKVKEYSIMWFNDVVLRNDIINHPETCINKLIEIGFFPKTKSSEEE